MTSTTTRHRFTVDDYRRMGESGIFAPHEQPALRDGIVFTRLTLTSIVIPSLRIPATAILR